MSKKEIVRTKDPMFSFLIYGNDKNKIKKIKNSSFGKNSLFDKLDLNNTYLVSFGLNKFDPTFVHYVEEKFDREYEKIKYRFSKKFDGFLIENDKKKKSSFYCFSRNLKFNKRYNENNIKKILIKRKKLKIFKFFGFDVFIVKARDFLFEGLKGMKNNKYFLVK